MMEEEVKRGFTLIELMIVVALLGIVAAIAIPNFQRFREKEAIASGKKAGKSISRVEGEARKWAQSLNIIPDAVNCLDHDSDGDGYVSCTLSTRTNQGDVKLIAVDCAGLLNWNTGCLKRV